MVEEMDGSSWEEGFEKITHIGQNPVFIGFGSDDLLWEQQVCLWSEDWACPEGQVEHLWAVAESAHYRPHSIISVVLAQFCTNFWREHSVAARVLHMLESHGNAS